jgi:hypothetical protein
VTTVAIVFSRKRPMQVDALLTSLATYAKDVFDEICVLYRLDAEYTAGYEKVRALHPGIRFVQCTDIKRDIAAALDCDFVSFFVDDDLVYRPVTRECFTHITDDVLCFSLRLGLNTTYCYPLDCIQALPLYESDKNGRFMKWAWDFGSCDFGYPYSIDGHVFRADEVRQAIERMVFTNPNEFEQQWQCEPTCRRFMVAFTTSCVVGVPANIVQTSYANRHERGSVEELNKLFLRNYRIDAGAMHYSVNAAHCPLEYKFRAASDGSC